MSFAPARTGEDRTMRTKGDPGTETTDPKFYCGHQTVSSDGWSTWDMTGVTSGKMLQCMWFQTKDAFLDDKVEMIFASDGTDVGTYGATNNEIASFGECNVQMFCCASGWSPEDGKGAIFQTSKLIPAGLKCRIKYYAAGTSQGTRELLWDALVHQ